LHKDGHRGSISVRVAPLRDGAGTITGASRSLRNGLHDAVAAERAAEIEKLAYLDPLNRPREPAVREIAPLVAARGTAALWVALRGHLHRYRRFQEGQTTVTVTERATTCSKWWARTMTHSARSLRCRRPVGRRGVSSRSIANVERDELMRTANRFRSLVEQSRLPGADAVSVTISIGAALARDGEPVAELLKRADRLLYPEQGGGQEPRHADV